MLAFHHTRPAHPVHYAGYRCQHDTDWIADKTRWGLSIDATERNALDRQLADCPDQPITVTLAR